MRVPDFPPRTVLMLPGIFGEEKSFSDLCDALGTRYDTQIVRYPNLAASTRLLNNIEATAAMVTARLYFHPLTKPVLIVGYSYGANLAFSIARRLLAEGRHVALVALLDPALPNTDFSIHQRGPATDFVGLPLPRVELIYRSRLLRTVIANLCRLTPAKTQQRFQRRTLWKLRGYARRAWKPSRVNCPVLHVMTEQFAPAVAKGWTDLCPNIRQVSLGTRHVDLLRGDALSDVVDLVQTELDLATQSERK